MHFIARFRFNFANETEPKVRKVIKKKFRVSKESECVYRRMVSLIDNINKNPKKKVKFPIANECSMKR